MFRLWHTGYPDAQAVLDPASTRPIPWEPGVVAGGARIGLLSKPAGTSPAKGCTDVRRYDRHWTPVHIDFNVDDFDSVLEKALAAGAKCEQIHKIPEFPPVAFCSDPFGHGFCIIGKRVSDAVAGDA
jgi:hypothetical protein